MQELYELNNEQLLLLKYYILRYSYNSFNPESDEYKSYSEILSNHVTHYNLKRDLGLKVFANNFSSYSEFVRSIILNNNYNELLSEYIKKGKGQELYLIIDKLLLIFSVKKEENIEIYNRLVELKNILGIPSLKDIFSKISNPFDSLELISEINHQMNNNHKIEVRNIYLSGDKKRKDKVLSESDKFDIAKKVIQDNIKYYFDNYKKGDRSLIPNDEQFDKIKSFMEKNIDLISKIFSSRLDFKYPDLDKICSNLKNENLIKFIKSLNAEFGFISEDNYGKDKYGNRFVKNNSSNHYIIGSDVRIYINTSYSKNGYLFITEYIKKCKKYGLDFQMKGIDAFPGYTGKDMTILYSLLGDLPIRIKILNEIQKEHPDWIDTFGSPLSVCGTINDSYYGISHIGTYIVKEDVDEFFGFAMCRNNSLTYNDYINNISTYAYYSTLADLLVKSPLINNVDSKMREKIIKFANLRINVNNSKSSRIGNTNNCTIDDESIDKILSYLREQNIVQQLLDLGYSLDNEIWLKKFQARIKGLHSLVQGFDRDAYLNPVISEFIMNRLSEFLDNEKNISNDDENKKGK